ncbi:molybdopterin molybdotransferase [Monaibacterium marinum]|uniref:Molybdopterin molybdenumtransferase n=1 Tax=Pontivivens marinum TaxID=1690039 RepID=A0A2C9CS45_9RHOB|nr:molybdopterin-binding protein [Monaibacterium marinum]SOH94077.1 molybdopterin molybdotransferase [Monaibacterium marinum]
MIFDTVIAVDWSARSTPSPAVPSKDAIWIGCTRDGVDEAPRYCRTRAQAMADVAQMVAQDRAAGRRVLIGFDFAFGWPDGFAAAITGQAGALAVWAHLADMMQDGPDNSNNRYDVAAALNAALPGVGPFWAKSHADRWPAIPYKDTRQDHGMPERRVVDTRASGAKPVWQLAGAGAVGSQSLVGVAHLERLRHQLNSQVWPFETGGNIPDGDVVLAEIYPALFSAEVQARRAPDEILDRAQVRVVASQLAALDRNGALNDMLDIRAMGDVVTQQEGWILGLPVAGSVPKLRNDCFALPPGVHWTPVDAALKQLRDGLRAVVGQEHVPLADAGGRVLAEDAVAVRSNPVVANSAVDGFTFDAATVPSGIASLPLVQGRSAAGVPYDGAVPAGSALRILTGAAIPAGCNTVVLQEDIVQENGAIRFENTLRAGANVRRAGEDFAQDAALLPTGRQLNPMDLALLAAGGLGQVAVRRKLRVAVLSSGDEVVDMAQWSGANAAAILPDANRPMLAQLLRQWGMHVVDLGIVGDDRADVRAVLDRGAAQADAILTTGGASAGDEDHISATLREADALRTWRIAVKPGRPLALGLWSGVPIFGLPGNPVAALVCALIFARPALMALAGQPWPTPTGMLLPAGFSKRKRAGRREYLRARLRDGQVEVYPSEGSGRIAGLSWAEGLCELPDGAQDITPGTPVLYHPWASFGL